MQPGHLDCLPEGVHAARLSSHAASDFSGGGVLAEVDGDPSVIVVEHGDELQAGAERFEILTKS